MVKKAKSPRTSQKEINYSRISPRNQAQAEYIDLIEVNDIVFGIGPAGTGKTFLAAHKAAEAFNDASIDKIVICRPIVEACGEDLGYLPGDIDEKTEPYMLPIYDAFQAHWPWAQIINMKKRKEIEICPLGYMRGRTFENCFVIADEMQNASEEQMLMLLTRIGNNTTMVITGDPQQRDYVSARGLEVAVNRLSGCPGIAFIDFDLSDVVRHKTVERVLTLWEKNSSNKRNMFAMA